MIPLMIGVLAVVVAIAGIALFAVNRVNNSEKIADGRTFRAGNDKQAEWSALAKQYDPEKGYEDRFTKSDGYRLCKELLERTEEMIKARCCSFTLHGAKASLGSLAEAEGLDPEKFLKDTFDLDELRQMHGFVLECADIGRELGQDIDCACVAANDSKDRIEQAKCREMLERVFKILDPAVIVSISYPTGDGRTGTIEKRVGIGVLSCLAQQPDFDLPMTPGDRAKALSTDGFRCRRCGRSPLSGGRLTPVWNTYSDSYEALCDDCHNSRA